MAEITGAPSLEERAMKTRAEADARVAEITNLAKQLKKDQASMQAHRLVIADLAIPLMQAGGVPPEDIETHRTSILAQEDPMLVAQAYLAVRPLDPALRSSLRPTQKTTTT